MAARSFGSRLVGRTAATCFLMLGSGCASGTPQYGASDGGQRERTNQVTVRNENAVPITVYALWEGGRRTRLGDLGGATTATFTTPNRGLGIRFEVEDRTAMSSRGFNRPNNYVPIRAGDHLEVITGRESFSGRSGVILSVRRVPPI